MLAGVMFPLWPYPLRLAVWYLSMAVLGLLGAFFALAILRLVFYIVTLVVAKPGIWVFPRLFEDVSFVRTHPPSFPPPPPFPFHPPSLSHARRCSSLVSWGADRRFLATSLLDPARYATPNQKKKTPKVDSWIPLWAWDVPAKKAKKPKKASSSSSSNGSKKEKLAAAGSAASSSSGVTSALDAASSAQATMAGPGGGGGARIEEIVDEEA